MDDFRELPILSLDHVMHVGTLCSSDKSNFSYEGSGLSISVDPERWEEIAQLGGNPWWKLSKASGSFIDAHALDQRQRERVSNWGVAKGYVDVIDGYQLTYFDDELEEERSILFEDATEAEWEAEIYDAGQIAKTKTLKATERLKAELGVSSDLNCFEHLLGVYAEQNTDFDGIWWEDEYGHLSAPRGVIFKSRLSDWQRMPTNATEIIESE